MVHLNRATCSTLFLNANMAMVWPILTSAARGELPSQFFKQEIVFLYGKQKGLSKQKLPRNQEPTQMAWNMRSYSTRTLHSKGCAVSTCNRWAYVLCIYIYASAYIYILYYIYVYIYYIQDLMSDISESKIDCFSACAAGRNRWFRPLGGSRSVAIGCFPVKILPRKPIHWDEIPLNYHW